MSVSVFEHQNVEPNNKKRRQSVFIKRENVQNICNIYHHVIMLRLCYWPRHCTLMSNTRIKIKFRHRFSKLIDINNLSCLTLLLIRKGHRGFFSNFLLVSNRLFSTFIMTSNVVLDLILTVARSSIGSPLGRLSGSRNPLNRKHHSTPSSTVVDSAAGRSSNSVSAIPIRHR